MWRSLDVWLVGVVVVAAAVRLYGLTSQGIWYDEAATITWASMSLDRWQSGPVVGLLKAPLVYLLLKGWMAVAGNGELALRLPFALLGAATVGPLYLLASRLVNRPAGLAAAGLLALHPMHVYYSQQVSEYAPLVLAVTVSMVVWLGAREQARVLNRTSLALLGLNTASLLIHPVAVVAPLTQVALDASGRRASLWVNGVPLVACALMLALTGADPELVEASLSWIPPLSGALLLETARQLSHGVMSHGGLVHEQMTWPQILLLALLAGLTIRGAASLARGSHPGAAPPRPLALLLVWIALPVVALAGWSLLVRNQWVPRYLLVALPALLTLAGAGLTASRAGRRLRPVAPLVGGLVTALLSFCLFQHHDQGGSGLREAAALLRRQLRPDDGVIISPDRLSLPFGYHYDRDPAAWLERTLRVQRRVTPEEQWLVTEFDAPRRHLHQRPGFARWLATKERILVLAVVDWPSDAHTTSLLADLRSRGRAAANIPERPEDARTSALRRARRSFIPEPPKEARTGARGPARQQRVRFFPYGSVHLFLLPHRATEKDE